jgi:hypothetical protein
VTLLRPRIDPHPMETRDAEALIREAHRLRRRRWVGAAFMILALVVLVGVVLVAFGGTGGHGPPKAVGPGSRPSGPAAPSHVPAQTVPPGNGVIGRGPTDIDFSDPQHGWIASGGNLGLETYNPTVLRTTDAGATWIRTPVPNLAAQAVDWQTNQALGGVVGVHFATPKRGWFYQDGISWQTNDAATRWTRMSFPDQGGVVALTSLGDDVWALVDSCPIHAVSCPQDLAMGTLYHAVSAQSLRWHSAGGTLPGGFGELYPGAAHGVIVALGSSVYRRSGSNQSSETETATCEPVGSFGGGSLAGVCGGSGGGNASLSAIGVSGDGGATWHTLVAGPPSTRYVGSLSTDGSNTIFYVTGGQTLWRTNMADTQWRPVLQVSAGSTDEIYPVFVNGSHGYALESDGQIPHWFMTNDDGVTWQPTTLP